MSIHHGDLDDKGDHDKDDHDKGEPSVHIQGEVLLSHYGTLQKNQVGQNVSFPEAPSPPNSCLYNLSSCFRPLKLRLFTFLQSLPRTLATTILRSVAVDFISIQLPGFPVTFIFVLGYFHFYIEIYRLALLSLLQQTTFTFMLMSLYFHTPIHVTSDKLTN